MDSRVLRNIDLNLLVVFEALMRERHVSRAAKKLAIGQPGLSGALARLRRLFDDPLLVRVGRDLQPTPRALELIGPVEQALQLIEGSTASRARFAPREANRTFTLGMTDDHELLFAPAVALALHQQAPAARLVIRPVDRHGLRGALDDGALDLALCALDGRMLVAWHGRQVLFQEGYACIWSPKRLRVAPRLTLKRFLEVPHVLVTFNGDLSGRIDDGLGALGKRRNVVVGVPASGGCR
jgi:DNA-binding transcriptional LysR family regulator